LTHDEVYVEASKIAMEEVFGTFAEGPDLPGDTASAHIRRALRGVGLLDEEIDAGLPRWCETFGTQYVRLLETADTSHWQLAPHVFEAAAAVEHRALLTGNPPVVAHARMERLGLAELFPRGQGAFGCERENRMELFDLARKRADDWPAQSTVGVGDTPIDVSSAHAAGCRSIAVSTGNYGREELSGADAVIADLGELESALARLA
jgi:phosphoglycolate phosphatase-like HAD superfamily hydrolase